jgi:hypothetical protein
MKEDERGFTVAGVRDLDGCTDRIDDAAANQQGIGHDFHGAIALSGTPRIVSPGFISMPGTFEMPPWGKSGGTVNTMCAFRERSEDDQD